LNKLFTTLFTVLYKAPANDFNWLRFKKHVLKMDKCEDFISRAATLEPIEVPKDKLEEL